MGVAGKQKHCTSLATTERDAILATFLAKGKPEMVGVSSGGNS
jgi:hypothetical protein